MKAIVFHGIGDISLDEVEEPSIIDPHDAIVSITVSAICGTDLHMVRGTMGGMQPGTILGHEGVGVVEKAGKEVRNFREGDRVVIPSTIACGYCSYCRSGYYSQCDNANPNGAHAGTCFFGGPKASGPINGLQAEKDRVPFANVGLVRISENMSDHDAIVLSDILPTGYFGAVLARIKPGNTVAVFGSGPVGLFAIKSALLMGASQVFAIDSIQDRLDIAREFGAEIINFEIDDPVDAIMKLTGGIGVDRAIDAVGIDAVHPHSGPAYQAEKNMLNQFSEELRQAAPETNPQGENWQPGDAPSQALLWAVNALAKAGTLSIIGVYPQSFKNFPIGVAMNKNIKINMGNCNHRKYIPMLMDMILNGEIQPHQVITNTESLADAVQAYKAFDQRRKGWVKVELIASKPEISHKPFDL